MSSSADALSTESCSTCWGFACKVGIQGFYDRYTLPAAEVVHQECSVCDEFDVNQSQLCRFCAHVRPAHLLTCSIEARVRYFRLPLGTIGDFETRQTRCAFCRWCLQVIEKDSQMQDYTINNEDRVYLTRYSCPQYEKHHAGIVEYSETIDSTACLRLETKTTGFESIEIRHNKTLLWESASIYATKLGYPKLKDFAAQPPLVIRWDTIRGWKAVCENEHICCEQQPAKSLPTNFRLIDVDSKSIVEDDIQLHSFFALSYVWGADSGNSNAELRKDNLIKLKNDGSLCDLPRTIAHAMDVCRFLGQRYLWVDRLCIVQDDKVDKYGQIQSMEAIYSRADLVIVAACGDSMQSGLPGVQNELPREQYQISTDIFGFSMANVLGSFHQAIESVWKQRGWTYQEAVLARRKLYFTETELWFECPESLKRENVFSSRLDASHWRGYHMRAPESIKAGSLVNDFEQYNRHLQRYSLRILTYPSDVYNAFRGIQNSFYNESDVLFGLPESDFSRALLWFSFLPGPQERQCSDRDMTLPSWSWASLIGAVTICDTYGDDEYRSRSMGSFYCSLCRWATWTVDETAEGFRGINAINDQMVWAHLDEIWSTKDSQRPPEADFYGEPDYRQFLALAWIKGCIEANVPVDMIGQKNASSMSPRSLAYRWPTVQDFWDAVQNSVRHEESFYDLPQLSAGHLVTRTQSAALRVKYSIDEPDQERSFVIFKTDAGGGEHIGSLINMHEYQLRGTKISDEAANVDFIALAVGCMPREVVHFVDEKVLEKNRFHFDQQELNPNFGQPGVIVMAVKWQGPIARRVALGWVTLQGWVDSKPEFRTVILS